MNRTLVAIALCLACIAWACHSRTALDIESCAGAAVAKVAADMLGQAMSAMVDAGGQEQADRAAAALAARYGIPAVLCALDVVARDLGGAAARVHMATPPGAGPPRLSPVLVKAAGFARGARASLMRGARP